MERIEIRIDDEAAKFWNDFSPEEKSFYEHKIADLIKEVHEIEPKLTPNQQAIVDKDAEGEPYEWWNDEEMEAELEQISADMDSGKDKGYTVEESLSQLRLKLKKK